MKESDAGTFFNRWGQSLALRDRSGTLQMMRDWWTEMKENHKVVSVIFATKDAVYTRPQRLTVLLLMIMSQMFANAYLFLRAFYLSSLSREFIQRRPI